MTKLRLGIIGCGGIANVKHFPALKVFSDQVDLVHFCDIDEARAVKAAGEYGTPDAHVTPDYTQLLADDTIDAVHVLTPNVSHSAITVAALEAGKHVLCEKPMAINYAEAKLMLDAARRTGKLLTIGYQNRFRRDVRQLRDIVDAGDLGEIYFAKAHAVRRKAVPTWGVFPDKSKQGGGPLIDIGTHSLDLTLWLMDNYQPKSVLGQTFQKLKDKPEGNTFGPWDPATFETEDSAFGLIKMTDGATIYLEAAWALNTLHPKEALIELCGTEGGAENFGDTAHNQGQVAVNTIRHGEQVEIRPAKKMSVYGFDGPDLSDPAIMEAAQWIQALRGDGEPLVKPEQAIVVTRILEAIYTSAASGQAVYFEEV
jgi:predicted dehydrogenase